LQPFAPDFLVHFIENIGHELLQAPLNTRPGADGGVT